MSGQCVCVCLISGGMLNWSHAAFTGSFRKLHYCRAECPAGKSGDPGNMQRRFVMMGTDFMGMPANPWLLLLFIFILSDAKSECNSPKKPKNQNQRVATSCRSSSFPKFLTGSLAGLFSHSMVFIHQWVSFQKRSHSGWVPCLWTL